MHRWFLGTRQSGIKGFGVGVAGGLGDGKLMLGYAKTDLLILDDWGLMPMTDPQRRDLLEILEDRYGKRSTIVTSQLPVTAWHDAIGDPTLADAILDRPVHNAHKIEFKGDSLRKNAIRLDQN